MHMSAKHSFRYFNTRSVLVVSLYVGIGCMGTQFCEGQSAEIFENGAASEDSSGRSEGKAEVAPEPVTAQPSRFAGTDLEPYTSARAAIFSMRNRQTDPFGLHQDPNVKPVRKAMAELPTKRRAALPPAPLSDIVTLINVTTIMPRDKKFLVGVRSFSESDEFTLLHRGKSIRLKIVKVSASEIKFRDIRKGEEAILRTGILPPGMVLGGGGSMRPPGMASPADDTPLRLDSARGPEISNSSD